MVRRQQDLQQVRLFIDALSKEGIRAVYVAKVLVVDHRASDHSLQRQSMSGRARWRLPTIVKVTRIAATTADASLTLEYSDRNLNLNKL